MNHLSRARKYAEQAVYLELVSRDHMAAVAHYTQAAVHLESALEIILCRIRTYAAKLETLSSKLTCSESASPFTCGCDVFLALVAPGPLSAPRVVLRTEEALDRDLAMEADRPLDSDRLPLNRERRRCVALAPPGLSV
ncbi:hypothetical protein MRX96_011781 [Rhipicephalus microplus]